MKPTSKSKYGRDNIPILLKDQILTTYVKLLQKAVGNFDCSQGFGKEPKRIFSTILNCSEERLFGSLKVI